MIEIIIRSFLASLLPVPVYLDRNGNTAETFVVIDHTGGSEKNHVRTAIVAIQSYGASLYDAATLAETVHACMTDSLPALASIGAVKVNSGPYNYSPGDVPKEYRYQAVYEITYYGG